MISETLTTAGFLGEGVTSFLVRNEGKTENKFHGGCLEIMDVATSYAEYITRRYVSEFYEREYTPGVYHYEVTHNIGRFIAEKLWTYGHVDSSTVLNEIDNLDRAFWNQE